MLRLLKALASLQLTVWLLALSMVLIFAGTLAQVHQGVWQVVDGYFRSPIAWIELQIFVPRSLANVPGVIPFPGGSTLGFLLAINLIAAHAVRFKLARKQMGLLVLHAGLIVLLAGEFATALMSEEGLMSIDEGASANYVENIREVELAIIDRSNPDMDQVVAIPQHMLERVARTDATIEDDTLPFSVRVDRWFVNADLRVASTMTPVNRGIGRQVVAMDLPRVRGVDGGQVDAPAAHVTLLRDGEELGTWMVAANLIQSQPVDVDGRQHTLALRFKRNYKPYALHLIDFRHDKFVGTEMPRNFSSRVRVVDPEQGTDREVLISMNNPLRYAGETFYQASYKADDSGTVLQVVHNPGWLLPYVATALVSLGMTLHFVIMMVAFLRRRASQEAKQPRAATPARARPAAVALPWAIGAFGLLLATSALFRPLPQSTYDIQTFAALPVSADGRVKPMDTVARNALMLAGGRQSIRMENGTVDAARFLLELMARPEAIKDYPILRVDHPDVLALMGLPLEDGGRLSLATIEPHWSSITQQAEQAFNIAAKQRDPFQREVIALYSKINNLLEHAGMAAPYAVPPLAEGEEWRPLQDAFLEAHAGMSMDGTASPLEPSQMPPAVGHLVNILDAFRDRDATAFNASVQAYDELLRSELPENTRKAGLEVQFNRASLFTGATAVYVIAFLLMSFSLLLRMRHGEDSDRRDRVAEFLRTSSTALIWSAFIIHTIAIVMRIYLQGRPPVTNLYSSAVFVGWASVLTGLLLERYFRLGVAGLGAAAVGFVTLVVAHNLGNDGDTMQMMQAVLDSNFWLATHVITISLGYSATFLAGALAIAYVLLGVFTKYLTPERGQALTKMVYGVICFALLLSFVGTVLGGIWADQSWGRFWGWDPKENGAALVVLITAIILHARWGRMIASRGIMNLAIVGNIVTAWSWFGTNMLGVGLHSYGFMDSAMFYLFIFVLSQIGIIVLGSLPDMAWRSHTAHAEAEAGTG